MTKAGSPTKRKYKNNPTEITTKAGEKIKFDSKKEQKRYTELLELLKSGEIRNLKLQPNFTLQEAYTTPGGERIRAVTYRADFSYIRTNTENKYIEDWRALVNAGGVFVVEDVKGGKATRTPEFEIKRKLFADLYGFEITII